MLDIAPEQQQGQTSIQARAADAFQIVLPVGICELLVRDREVVIGCPQSA
jgi:hypothetical protein